MQDIRADMEEFIITGQIAAQAEYDRFMKTFLDLSTPAKDGIRVLDEFQVVDSMRKDPRCMAEWEHWSTAARAGAILNSPGRDLPSKEEIGDFFAKYFMRTDVVTTPRFNMSIALMKFATHQALHAFGRTEGLPYPNPDGSHTYSDPGSALEEAMTGRSKVGKRVDKLWPRFLEDTARRVGFDLESAMK